MELTFKPQQGHVGTYCCKCQKPVSGNARTGYRCNKCGMTSDRAIIFDSSKWWLSGKTLRHEVTGIFLVRREDGKFLFFDRTMAPKGRTVPAGHVEKRENPTEAAQRELKEEADVRLRGSQFNHAVSVDIPGLDKCRRGSDDHTWHIYVALHPGTKIRLNNEGRSAGWFTLRGVLQKRPTPVVSYLIHNYYDAISATAEHLIEKAS